MKQKLVLIRGGGDLASGVAHRLHRCGFRIIITEIPNPTVIRRTVAFAEAIYSGHITVEGVTAVLASSENLHEVWQAGQIPVLVDPEAHCGNTVKPWALVDAIIAKRNTGTAKYQAKLVIGIGPGFTAGIDVHAVVETMRGHDLGRVIVSGAAMPDTGIPGEIGGYTIERLLRAPANGTFQSLRQIGDTVSRGEAVAQVDGVTITAEIGGIIRGMLRDGLSVTEGQKVGDIDPRCRPEHCFTISDKARAIGGGVLEALLWLGGGNRVVLR